MGSLQPGPAGLPDQGASIDLLADLASWLDGLMTTSASGGIASNAPKKPRDGSKKLHLEKSFGHWEGSTGPGSSVEIAFYHHWIDANTDTSPLLYAAWFMSACCTPMQTTTRLPPLTVKHWRYGPTCMSPPSTWGLCSKQTGSRSKRLPPGSARPSRTRRGVTGNSAGALAGEAWSLRGSRTDSVSRAAD